MSKPFIKSIWTKPPIIFPLVALFHLVILCYTVWNYKEFPFPSEYWVSPLWVLLYTTFWIFLCDLKRWAAFAYIALTALAVILQFTLKYRSLIDLYTPSFYLVFVLFCVIVLFYYKKLR